MKAERLPAGPTARFVGTHLKGTPQSHYDDNDIQRGDMENRIKEPQRMRFNDRTRCHDFLATSFRRLLSSFAYVLVETPRRNHLADRELAEFQPFEPRQARGERGSSAPIRPWMLEVVDNRSSVRTSSAVNGG